jgi:hypothetical protein
MSETVKELNSRTQREFAGWKPNGVDVDKVVGAHVLNAGSDLCGRETEQHWQREEVKHWHSGFGGMKRGESQDRKRGRMHERT